MALRQLLEWPVVRQLRDADLTAPGRTAYSQRTEQMHSRIADATAVPSVCPYCATGCAQTVDVRDDKIAGLQGGAGSPISRGRLCPKRQATMQYVTSSQRLTEVKYRAPGVPGWTTIPLSEALDMVVDRILDGRDATWQDRDEQGRRLQRTMGISLVGGATLDNEESNLLRNLTTLLGTVQMDNQARICHSPSLAAGP